MAEGILASAALAADVVTSLYTCGQTRAMVSLNIVALTGSPTVRAWLVPAGSPDIPQAEHAIEYDTPLVGGGEPLLREGLYMQSGDILYVEASDANVSAVVYGREVSA